MGGGVSQLRAVLTGSLCALAVLASCGPADRREGVREPRSDARSASCRGIAIRPGVGLRSLAAAKPVGTTFCFGPGVYRLSAAIVPKDRQKFIAAPGTVINGARRLKLEAAGKHWKATGQRQSFPPWGVCSKGTTCRRSESVFYDGKPLQRVSTRSNLGPGKFFFDLANDTIFIADDPNGHHVEAAKAPAFVVGRKHIHGVVVEGFVVEKFGNHAQLGAIDSQGGKSWVVRNNEVRYTQGAGICFHSKAQVVSNHVHHNGQIGICGVGRDAVVRDNEIAFNNTKQFDWYWEAGGSKFVETQGLLVKGNYVHNNIGPGLWTDHENTDTTYADNLVEGNWGAGIFHEISYGATIRDNVVRNNAHRVQGVGNLWWGGAGILVGNSSDVEVYGNTLADNNGGIGIIQSNRGAGTRGAFESSNVFVHDNSITIRTGTNGLVTNDGSYYTSKGNRFVGNTYFLDGLMARRFEWNHSPRDKDEWRDFGLDINGTFLLAP